jgi:hypothetical protein
MSTNSTISIKRADGTKTAIYCHYDGYIEGAGVILQLAYNTAEKVEELLKLGDLSTLGYYTEANEEKSEHNFEKPQENVCVAYHRDRGESFNQSSGMREYNYTFDEREAVWYVEKEEWKDDTTACRMLNVDGFCSYHKSLLLDAIISCTNIEEVWQDDEFAKAGEVIETCKKKAREARAEIIKQKQEEHEAYYRAYCD